MLATRTGPKALVAVLSLLAVACGASEETMLGGGERIAAALVDHGDWVPAAQEPGELRDHAPTELRCPNEAWQVTSDGVLDVSTGDCNYFAVEQPALRDVPAGSVVSFTLSHLDLFDPNSESAQAHVALMIGSSLLWERTVPIPSPALIYHEQIILEDAVSADDPVFFHLHNHGTNEWKLLDIVVETD